MVHLPHQYCRRVTLKNWMLTVGIVAGLAMVGVFGLDTSARAASGDVTVHISNSSRNSASCRANGVTHVYVTVANVKAHRSGKGNAGFTSLTSGSPEQFDLLFGPIESSEAFNESDCPIAELGGAGLPPGKYQQIRLITVDNGATTSGGAPIISSGENACNLLGDKVYNCVVDATGTLHPLTIPSGDNTGIKISSSQVSHGGFSVAAGQGVDLDLDINVCRSLAVRHGHGKGKGKHGGVATYALKPVLHAGEVSLQSIIAGSVVVGTGTPGSIVTATGTAVPNASVWLESQPSNVAEGTPLPSTTMVPVSNVLAETTTDPSGKFSFCPVPTAKYNIVVDAPTLPSATKPSDATVTTGVTVTDNGGPNNLVIPLLQASAAATTLSAQVSTAVSSTAAGVGDDIAFHGTQTFDSSDDQAPIPLYGGTAASPVTTGLSTTTCTCAANTKCACFQLAVPPDNPVTGAANGSYSAGIAAGSYSLLGNASVIAGTTPECAPSQLISASHVSPLLLPTLSFTGCN